MEDFTFVVLDRLNRIEGKLDTVVGRVTKLEIKSSIWGMAGGAVAALVYLLVK